MATTLDTSGAVVCNGYRKPGSPPDTLGGSVFRWSDLSPFAQGYVEAMFSDLLDYLTEHLHGHPAIWPIAFRYLSPEALALILRDCEAHPNAQPHKFPDDTERQHRSGRNFWTDRQDGEWAPTWAPLKAYCATPDGKVCLREST